MLGNWTFLLLFGSGLSALTYQMVWMREFRLVFGASTASTAAVSALFMAGLGIGGWLLGSRADRHSRPLVLYAKLELLISAIALVSPLLLHVTRSIYLQTGGMMVLGMGGATLARLLLAAVVIGVPTFLMGGTLPAAVRAVTLESDGARRNLGLLYGVNTLGALTGTVLTTFWILEALGARYTLSLAVAVNLIVALTAMAIGKRMPEFSVSAPPPKTKKAAHKTKKAAPPPEENRGEKTGLPQNLALAAAAGVGFAFFLMELVWYRMLAPVLGGSTYTFGLILAVALAGIGLGGAAYPVIFRNRRPGAAMLAGTCLLEALFLLLPYAAGDRIVALAAQLMPLSALGFMPLVGAWTVIAFLVVFPAAFISGVQFPLLIALLGRGAKNIGRETGRAYAANTLGAIAGSLAGGFGLLPWLTAPGCWLLVGALLTVFGIAIGAFACLPANRPEEDGVRRKTAVACGAVFLLCLGLCFAATGPTAAWRHSPVGAGRIAASASGEAVQAWMAERRWYVEWEADGVESAIGIINDDGYSFFVNGKSDGNVLLDKGTQILCGLVGAALHPAPKKSLVVGLGTGSSAGWLGLVDGMQRVDVVELEPAVLHMARLSSSANGDVLNNPRVRIVINDAREVLTTVPETYDLIVSEPSNPYRAGIASLFTLEFYREVANRLAPGGLFVSWCQAYEIDTETVFTILNTLKKVFPHVECWATQSNDLAFIASLKPVSPSLPQLTRRLATDTFRTAMRIGWGLEGVEGFLSRFVARNEFIDQAISAMPAWRYNTDDLMRVEYDYARTVGRQTNFSMLDLYNASIRRGTHIPEWASSVNQEDILFNWSMALPFESREALRTENFPQPLLNRLVAVEMWRQGQFGRVLQQSRDVVRPPLRLERLAWAESLAEQGNDEALQHVAAFEDWWPACAALVRARLLIKKNSLDEAAAELEKAFLSLRKSPWEMKTTVDRGYALAQALAGHDAKYAPGLLEALSEPFALRFLEAKRRITLLNVAARMGLGEQEKVLERWFEPYHPWNEGILAKRVECYEASGNARLAGAKADLAAFRSSARLTVTQMMERATKEPAAP